MKLIQDGKKNRYLLRDLLGQEIYTKQIIHGEKRMNFSDREKFLRNKMN